MLLYYCSVSADGSFGSWGDLCCCKQSLCCSALAHQQSSSVYLEPVGSLACIGPMNISAPRCRPSAPELYTFWTGSLPVVWCFLSMSAELWPFSLAMPWGSALHCFVRWLAAGWHIVPKVLIRCQLLYIFTLPPCLTLPVGVTACLHLPSAHRKYENKRFTLIKWCFLSSGLELLGLWQARSRLVGLLLTRGSGASGDWCRVRAATERFGQICCRSSKPWPGKTKQWRRWTGALVWGVLGEGGEGERRRVKAEAWASVTAVGSLT